MRWYTLLRSGPFFRCVSTTEVSVAQRTRIDEAVHPCRGLCTYVMHGGCVDQLWWLCVQVCDFGYSKHEKYQSAPGSRVGTPAYLAPEVIMTTKGKTYDGKVRCCRLVPECREWTSRPVAEGEAWKTRRHPTCCAVQACGWLRLCALRRASTQLLGNSAPGVACSLCCVKRCAASLCRWRTSGRAA